MRIHVIYAWYSDEFKLLVSIKKKCILALLNMKKICFFFIEEVKFFFIIYGIYMYEMQ